MEVVAPRCSALRFGAFEIDLRLRELRKRGIRIQLAGHPFQVLVMLVERPGEVVTREHFQKALWPGEPWGDHEHGLNKAVNKVREALNDTADNPRFLATVPRVGYRFLAPVERHMEPVTGTSGELPSGADELPSKYTAKAIRLLAGAAGLLAVAIGITIAFRLRTSRPDPFPQPAEAVPLTSYVGSEVEPSFSPDGESVAFMWNGEADSVFHIYLTTMNRTGPRRLTNSESSDYGPAWSPDGKRIVFWRVGKGTDGEVRTINKDGSDERKIADVGFTDLQHPIAWTRDPKWLVVSEQMPGDGPAALYLLSTETGEKRRLTSPPVQSGGDWSPAVSPDGSRLAFTRPSNSAWRDIFVVPLSSDLVPAQEPRQLTNLHRIIDTIAWTPNGQELFFSAAASLAGARFLFRMRASQELRAAPRETGLEGLHPAVSPNGGLLVYSQQNIEQTSIWRLRPDSRMLEKAPQTSRLLSSTRRDFTADLSPDGKRLVFSSARTGLTDIWMSGVDGSQMQRLTSFGASTPRWSPDGRRVVFESTVDGQSEIYAFDLKSRKAHRLTFDPGPDVRPSWSRDGEYIYFSSKRTGRYQLWKVPSDGGQAIQITRSGGVYGVEASDGKLLYYLTADQPAKIAQISVAGGDEQDLVSNVIGYSAIALAQGGLYFLSSITSKDATLERYDFATHARRRVLLIDRPVHHFLSSPPDGKSILYTQIDRQESDLMLRPIAR
jgi:Tol biopolymer transport system component/DNA-binding winged helix-turn-helix (wHTH) protein